MLFTMLVWGVGPVFLRSLSVNLGPADFLVIRYTLVSMIYGTGLLFTGPSKIELVDWPRLLIISLLGILGYNLGSVYGFQLVPAGMGGLIIGTQPLLIVFIAALVSRESVTSATFAGLLVAFAGTILLFWSDLTIANELAPLLRGATFIFLSG
ncbi:MAG TPA: DMT family transporter, partial [Terriglobales bacterium]